MLLPTLERVLDGRDPALVAVPVDQDDEAMLRALRVGSDIDDDVALVVTTSGTTGAPKGAMLTAAALTASASATQERLGGPGNWLLALPPYHVAGLQVLVRSVLAGSVPVELDVTSASRGFDISELPGAVSRLGPGRRYTSLVAAQLAKALTDPAAAAALAELDAVLIGGGPAPRPILDAAAAAGIAVVRTYGMSETAGGCVYDGVPLDGVQLRVLSDGRIAIGGATLAKGYRNPVVPDPFAEPGWFYTDDLGTVDGSGVLTVLGRADDAISTGGLTVLPQPVEAALCTHPAVSDCAVFGVDDDRLGQRVVAAVVVVDGCTPPTLDTLRAVVVQTLDATAAPRELHVVDALPRRGIGKVDRAALVRRFAECGRSIGWAIVRIARREPAAVAVAVVLVAAAFVLPRLNWGINPRSDIGLERFGTHAGAAPIFGYWDIHAGWGTILALLIAVAAVVWGPAVAQRLSWRLLTLGTWATACGWAFSLAMIDGWQRGFAGRLTTRDEYLSQVPGITDIPATVRRFSTRILDFQPDSWTTHVSGHPPGAC